MRILVIEDHPSNMKLVTRLLTKEGHEVLQATDGGSGVETAIREMPDLILMDIQLPGIDGLTATRLLKEDEKTGRIPIIALTAFAMKGDEQRMLDAGCDGYISKPIRYREFLDTVESFLKREEG
ncbi:MAG: response regulator [Thermodesulfobacteriota bacterium]